MCTTLRELLRRYLEAADDRGRERLRGPLEECATSELMRMLRARALPESHPAVHLPLERVFPILLAGGVAEERVEHYLQRVVTNAITDALRQERRHRGAAGIEIPRLPDARVPDTVRVIAARERLALVRHAMASGMPENYRLVIEEIYFKGRDRDDLARERGVEPGTVDRWVSRARVWLLARLAEREGEERS